MAEDLLAVHFAAGEEFGDILVSRPVDGNAEVVAVFRLEIGLVLLVVEPVVTEPVEVGELLVGQLVDVAIRRGGEFQADEVVEIEAGIGDVLAFVCHPLGQRACLLVAPMGADQVRVVDIGVVDVLARLHLRLQLLDHVAFADQIMGDLDAGDVGERLGERLGFIFMGGQRFGNDLDLHAGEGFRRIDEPLHFLFLIGARQARHVADFRIQEFLRLVHAGKGRAAQSQQHRCRRRQKMPSHTHPP